MKEPIEFTHREKYLLSYYSDSRRTRSRRFLYDGSYLAVSLGCLAWYFFKNDDGMGFVAYAILFVRIAYGLTAQSYSEDFQSLLEKYDAKVKELTEKLDRKQG